MCTTLKNKLPTLCQTLFEAKAAKRITFADIGKKIDKDEVWVAAVFYGQAKPEESDLKKLSVVLDIKENYLTTELGTKTYFPDRGGLFQMPPTDPVIYRFYEILQVYGYPLKAIINEKFGDGIMSAIDFTAKVDKIEKDDHERVKITFDVAHRIATLDAQPSINNGIIVMVTGELLETNAQRFSQAFQLIPEGSTYWVLNDVFRLNYG
ncbi:6385_t:CDS:10 [Funneliformis mosseae]|uniref:Cyanate hydratase n=1 Tax=Funneliformis mosseae TaxID=27381 RepID=A0A9N9C1U9_FUNMO|nr:6385_t:CDS:10 [Funneliformis mosseae]